MNDNPIILINKNCQAKCSHCPYGKKEIEPYINLQDLLREIKANTCKLLIFSGGEPFEYPLFSDLTDSMKTINKPFRIATGGHVSIIPYINNLQNITCFTGISLGTDIIIMERNSNHLFHSQWLKNLFYLNSQEIHYSISITIGKDINLNKLLSYLLNIDCNPDFFMFSEKENENVCLDEWKASSLLIEKLFPGKSIKIGFRN